MDCDLWLDQLRYDMEELEKILFMKRMLLQRECDVLQILLKPWKVEELCHSASVGPITELRTPEHVENIEDDELKENLQRIDELLAKVHTTRHSVVDDEVRGACQLDSINLRKSRLILKNTKPAGDTSRPTGDIQVHKSSAAASKSNFKPANSSKSKYRTTYTQSFQPPKCKSFDTKGKTVSKAATEMQLHKNCKDRNHLLASRNGTTNNQVAPVENTVSTASTASLKVCQIKSEEIDFNLMKNGTSLKLPKNFVTSMRRRDQLQKLVNSTDENVPQLPPSLEVHYSKLEYKALLLN